MTVLSPHLPMRSDESVIGFASRLAHFHTGKPGLHLIRSFGVDTKAFLAGEDQAAADFCILAGITTEEFRNVSIRRAERHRQFRNERWSRAFVKPDGLRFCPVCLLADGDQGWDRYARLNWRVRPVRLCVHHGVVLSDSGGQSWGDEPWPFPRSVELHRLSEIAQTTEVTTFDQWIHERIAGNRVAEGNFLKAQTLEQGVKVCEMLGATLDHGLTVTVSNLSEAQLADSAAQGFQIAVRGEDAVMEALGNIRAMATSRAGQAKFRAMYGNLYEWVRSTGGDIDPGPIRDLLREHILQTTAIGQGELVLGHEITQRRMHSAYSLAIAMRLHPKRLRKILVRLGIASENCDDLDYNRLVFPVGDTERICLDLISAVPLSGLPREIGCTRSQAEGLCHGGLIIPIATSGGGIGRIDFARAEITNFLEWMSSLPEVSPADSVDLTLSAKMTSLSTAELIRRAKEGDLIIGRLPGEPRVSALMIPMLAIREIQTKTRGPPATV